MWENAARLGSYSTSGRNKNFWSFLAPPPFWSNLIKIMYHIIELPHPPSKNSIMYENDVPLLSPNPLYKAGGSPPPSFKKIQELWLDKAERKRIVEKKKRK